MKLHRWSVGDGVLETGGLCCAIGNFDGVHKGHQALIGKARSAARARGLPLAVICFSPHPRRYFQPDQPPFLLMDTHTKLKMLAEQQVDMVIEITFDAKLQMMGPEEFVRDVLHQALDVRHLFAGADFAFGKGRSGTMELLQEYGQPLGMAVEALSLILDEGADIITSTAIRTALQTPDLELAAALLGRVPILSGIVAEGDKRGRQLNFPTANIALQDCMAPAFGVYAIKAGLEREDGSERMLAGVANIGRRPTVNDRGILAEAHLFDFAEDIYGQRLNLYLHRFIRPEQKFDGLEALTAQIAKDVAHARDILAA